ncbi:MAG: hypothetical protein NTZ13_00640 [Candidatus Parcubacteria bacterium]|nr:hypothetical protein [Candidatus Parcubacteria bacterium]
MKNEENPSFKEEDITEIVRLKKDFIPKLREEEILTLQKDTEDFDNTVEYLKPLIKIALSLFEMENDVYEILYSKLLEDVKLAAKMFLGHEESMNASYGFYLYYSWYISSEIDEAVKMGYKISRKVST